MADPGNARPRGGLATTAGILACLGAAHRLLSAVGSVALFVFFGTGDDERRAQFALSRTILAVTVPIWSIVGVLLLTGGILVFRRRPLGRWLVFAGCVIDVVFLVGNFIFTRVVLGGPGLLIVGVLFPILTMIVLSMRPAPGSVSAPVSAVRPESPLPAAVSPAAAPNPAGTRERGRTVLLVATAFVVVGVVVALVVTAVLAFDTDESHSSTASSTAAAAPSTVPESGWGKNQWIADMFPRLLPSKPNPGAAEPTPDGLKCESQYDAGIIACSGNPARTPYLTFYCYPGTPYSDPLSMRVVDVLPRSSGTVRLLFDDRMTVTAMFSDMPRAGCRIDAKWSRGLDELLDWWRAAPL